MFSLGCCYESQYLSIVFFQLAGLTVISQLYRPRIKQLQELQEF